MYLNPPSKFKIYNMTVWCNFRDKISPCKSSLSNAFFDLLLQMQHHCSLLQSNPFFIEYVLCCSAILSVLVIFRMLSSGAFNFKLSVSLFIPPLNSMLEVNSERIKLNFDSYYGKCDPRSCHIKISDYNWSLSTISNLCIRIMSALEYVFFRRNFLSLYWCMDKHAA